MNDSESDIGKRKPSTFQASGLIDPIDTQHPRYRKLHIALNIAIVQEVLERHELTTATCSMAKRSAEQSDNETGPSPLKK